MVFSSFLFLFAFLPVFFICYFIAPYRLKNAVLLAASYLFYAWGAPKIVVLFFISCLLDYILGRAIGAAAGKQRLKKVLLCGSLMFNLGALFYFKYANFFVHELNRLAAVLGVEAFPWAQVVLPIGISFFTFHKISYIVDVYRGIVKPASNLIDFSLYIALFPQLIAGPIIRYHDINSQITSRTHSIEDVFMGITRFCTGLGKKVLIADAMGNVADNVFRLGPAELSTPYAWLGIVCYAYQIYFDFSGYSDMAIGLGRMMGFHFLENFDRPYIAQTFTEFWRRWHISLSRWMRDYLYIPLGGNRASPGRTYFNLWVVFLLSGLWHGANWTFVAWGFFHGFFLCLDKLFWLNLAKRLNPLFNTVLTFMLVLISWVFFRSETLAEAASYLARMFNVFEYWTLPGHALRAHIIHNRAIFIFVLATVLSFAPIPAFFRRRAEAAEKNLLLPAAFRFSAGAACLILSALALSTTNYNPFIYFRF